MRASRSFWDHQVLHPAPAAHRLSVGGKAVLFDDRSQQLFELNDSSEAIWDALALEQTPAGAARLLAPAVADFAVALGFVHDAVAGWLRMGLVRPDALNSAPSAGARRLQLQWMGRGLSLGVWDEAARQALSSVFAPFVSTDAPGNRLDAQQVGDLVFLSDDQGHACARSPDEWIPEVKARFTAKILEADAPGCLVHAALLSRRGQGVLICGAPGAGKTTLAVSLLLAGFDYHTDDIVWIGEAGEVAGAPFAPALKPGTWPLLAEMGDGPPASPTYLRGDGQSVKYLLAPAARPEPVDLNAILLLERSAETPAGVGPAEPLEVLTTLLGSAYSARAALSAPALKALAGKVESARLGRLRFADWRDGRRLVDAFAA